MAGSLLRPAWAALPYTPQQLAAIHQNALSQTAAAMESATLSGDASQYYFTSIYLMGMLSAVDATQNDTELQQALHYIDNMIAQAIPNTYTNFQGQTRSRIVWGPLSSGVPNELYNYQAAQPIARAAVIINKYPTFKSKYGAKAQAYAAFVDGIVIQRWYVDVYNENPEWLTGDPPSWGDNGEWNDKSWLLGDIAASLYEATGGALYLTLLNKISTGFRGFLQPLGTGWIWNYHTIPIGSDTDGEPGSVGNQDGSPDTDHANRVPMMMINQFEVGLGGWALSDLQRLGATVADTMWNQSTASPLISNYVDGSNKPYRTHMNAGENGFLFAGWAMIGKYSSKALTAGESVMQAIQKGTSNPTVGENSDAYYKTVGLSGHLLWAASAATAPTNSCDLNGDGVVNVADVQKAIIQMLGLVPCRSADLLQNGQCSAADIQRVVNASLGSLCKVGP